MPPERMPRRRFLRTSAAASGLLGVSIAGCTDFVDDGVATGGPGPDRERPGYAAYVPDGALFEGDAFGGMYAFVDFEAMAEFEEFDVEGDLDPGSGADGAAGDAAFVAGPTLGLLVYFLGTLGLVGYPFVQDLIPDLESSSDGGSTEFETDVGVVTDFGYVFVGEYDVDALAELAADFEVVDERDGFTMFEGQAADEEFGYSMAEGLTFAASDEEVLVPMPDSVDGEEFGAEPDPEEGVAMIDTMIDVVTGEESSAADADADVDWMLRTSGHGPFGIGAFGDEDEVTFDDDGETADGGVSEEERGIDDDLAGEEEDEFDLMDEETRAAFEAMGRFTEDARVYGSNVEMESESEAAAHVALGYGSAEDVPDEAEFEDVFGDVEGEFEMETGETRVYLSTTYSY